MPRAARKTETPDPNLVYVSWQSGSVDVDGTPYSFVTGERLRGDSPAVKAAFWCFVPDGTPDGEMPSAFSQVVELADAARAAPDFELTLAGALPTPLAIEDTIRLTRTVRVRGGYVSNQEVVTYERDTILPAASELASLLPDDAYEHTTVQFTRPKGRRR
jgi:hypothetical protein